MIEYLKPLIWVLLAVLVALALHAALRMMPSGQTVAVSGDAIDGSPAAPGPVVNPPPGPSTPVVAPGPGPAVPPPGPGPVVTPPPGPGPAIAPPPVGPALSGIDRVGQAQWEKALTQNGFVKKDHPRLHAGDKQYTSYVFAHNGVETAWAFLQVPSDNLVARLEFYVDGPDAVPLADRPAAIAGGNAIVLSCKALDQALGDQITPVLYSPYSGPDAFQPTAKSVYKGFARDVGHYIALRLTARNDMQGAQFLLLWKDPEKKVGALQNSLDFAAKCTDAKWETFTVPAN